MAVLSAGDSLPFRPSVISSTPPCATPACCNSCCARAMALAGCEPCAGIRSGLSTSIWLAMVCASVVSGLTTKGVAAYTISAVSPSFCWLRMSRSFSLARSSRLGLTSVASIERDRSNTTTCADCWRNTGCGSFCQAGPASARIASTPPTPSATIAHGPCRAALPISKCANNCGSTTRCQLWLVRRRCHIHPSSNNNGNSTSNQSDRRK